MEGLDEFHESFKSILFIFLWCDHQELVSGTPVDTVTRCAMAKLFGTVLGFVVLHSGSQHAEERIDRS